MRTALSQLELGLNPGEFVPAQADATFVLAMADATAAELMPGLIDAHGHVIGLGFAALTLDL